MVQGRCPNGGKLCFRTKRKAQRAAERLLSTEGVKCRAYECPSCGDWHLTSQALRKRS